MKRKKLYLGALLLVMATSSVASPQVLSAKTPAQAVQAIERKQKKINKNSHIPKWKKKMINEKLNAKKAMLKKKYS